MKDEYLYILCKSNGYIPQLKMAGPIVHPLKISKKTAIKMIMSGLKVFEYDKETKNTVELTLVNIEDENRMGTNKIAKAHNVETPVTVIPVAGVPKTPNLNELPLNEDGTVNESAIDMTHMSNNQKKKLRNKIAEINAAATKVEETPVVEESSTNESEAIPAEESTPVENTESTPEA